MTGIAARLVRTFTTVVGPWPPLRVRAWDGSVAGPAEAGPLLLVRSRRALRYLLWRPDELGLARAFVAGDLDVRGSPRDALRECGAVLRQRQQQKPHSALGTTARLAPVALRLGVTGPPRPPAEEARLRGRLHTRQRDRQAIAHHYDLGNNFYRLLLDPSMAYSCAYWAEPEARNYGLDDAQRDKLDLICGKLGLQPGMRLLDIGCGWGSLVVHAAKHYGVYVTGVTLSEQQRTYVDKVLAEEGLRDRARVQLRDYRDLPSEQFDSVASIEMGEHVGEEAYPYYVSAMHRLLRPGGKVLLQQMSRDERAPGGGAFIERYIAPDMTMRPLHHTIRHLQRAGFEIRQVAALRDHYVRTVDSWAQQLEDHWDDVVTEIGIGWARVWRLYLAGGALAFEENRMGVDQILAARQSNE